MSLFFLSSKCTDRSRRYLSIIIITQSYPLLPIPIIPLSTQYKVIKLYS